ncbi:hypothetical protein AYO45_03445 [Gammaproteobacteria bacterium SCGC AG-212-F23]|nr:hypothetical protein AYO45_03445 [Gammaproteobacteria bacterium SCGC AG-212-F23]
MSSRIFQAQSLAVNSEIQLDERAYHYLARVLRATVGDTLVLFNGEGGEYLAKISYLDKKKINVFIENFSARECESPLNLHLAQGISRGEKMDFTIQKAVELGVKKITPLFTERCNVKLDDSRSEKRKEHWQSIIISACEQCGRNQLPEILPPISLEKWLTTITSVTGLVLAPEAKQKLSDVVIATDKPVVLLIGPEGGLTAEEIALVEKNNFSAVHLGPRILRTESAGLAAIAVLQSLVGDF